MILKSLKYRQYIKQPAEWILKDFEPEQINLIVGKNASGKTRTFNVILALSNLISGDIKLSYESGYYDCIFQEGEKTIEYKLYFENTHIIKEVLKIESENLLDRKDDGNCKIKAVELNKKIKIHIPTNELACVSRRDKIQHPFFDGLYQWGKNVRSYYFGTALGKDTMAIFTGVGKNEPNLKDSNTVVSILKKGIDNFGNDYEKNIIKDMKLIGYSLKEIGVKVSNKFLINGRPNHELEGVFAQESDLKSETMQTDMSQGMFRALSLLIQLNYSLFDKNPSCVLIDDIGEGLDYERSSKLIKILIAKAKKSKIQLIMTTNDRFVMNNVSLDYWSVIHREGNISYILNKKNSEDKFKDFAFTGLSNFDFFSTEFFKEGFKKSVTN